jgi:hypothetical protein
MGMEKMQTTKLLSAFFFELNFTKKKSRNYVRNVEIGPFFTIMMRLKYAPSCCKRAKNEAYLYAAILRSGSYL